MNVPMTKEMEDASKVNNSTLTNTPDCESVDLLFGLTPNEAENRIGYYFDESRIVSVAIADMLEAIKKNSIDNRDNYLESIIEFTEIISILTDFERAGEYYSLFKIYFNYTSQSSEYEDQDEEAVEAAKALHEQFLGIIRKINKIGFFEFTEYITLSLSGIKIKRAYEDVVISFCCIINLYVSYEHNLRRTKQ